MDKSTIGFKMHTILIAMSIFNDLKHCHLVDNTMHIQQRRAYINLLNYCLPVGCRYININDIYIRLIHTDTM